MLLLVDLPLLMFQIFQGTDLCEDRNSNALQRHDNFQVASFSSHEIFQVFKDATLSNIS